MLRSLTILALLGACQADIGFTAPEAFTIAVFDPTTSKIPLPNDLAFLNPVNTVCPPPANTLPDGSPPACAQAELLAAFAGKFPSDQGVAITIDFAHVTFDAAGQTTQSAPDLDLATFTPATSSSSR